MRVVFDNKLWQFSTSFSFSPAGLEKSLNRDYIFSNFEFSLNFYDNFIMCFYFEVNCCENYYC